MPIVRLYHSVSCREPGRDLLAVPLLRFLAELGEACGHTRFTDHEALDGGDEVGHGREVAATQCLPSLVNRCAKADHRLVVGRRVRALGLERVPMPTVRRVSSVGCCGVKGLVVIESGCHLYDQIIHVGDTEAHLPGQLTTGEDSGAR